MSSQSNGKQKVNNAQGSDQAKARRCSSSLGAFVRGNFGKANRPQNSSAPLPYYGHRDRVWSSEKRVRVESTTMLSMSV